jgi:rod shape-determining protein MreB
MMFDRFFSFLSLDVAIDLGTANTLVYVKGRGVVCNEPSVVAVQRDARGVRIPKAVGKAAKEMLGKTPGSIEAIRPIKDGVIADFEIAEKLITHFIGRVHNHRSLARPRAVIAVPHGITEVERRAVRESAEAAGCSQVFLIEEAMAAAIGADLPIHEPGGNMILDIGGGTTGIAVISLLGSVFSKSVRVGGDVMDEAIVNYLKRRYNMLIGERTAEQVKIAIGSAYPDGELRTMMVKGRDLVAGVPRTIEVGSDEIREALRDPIRAIVDGVLYALEQTPPELASDIIDKGIVLAGGGALIRNLDVLIREETGLPVMIAENPLQAVVLGSGRVLDNMDLLRQVTF